MSKYWPLIKLLPVKTNFKFVKYSPIIGGLTALAAAASLFFTIWPGTPPCGGLNCGVDFRGGTVLELSTADGRPADLGKIRDALAGQGLGDIQVQAFGKASDVLVRFEVKEAANATRAVDSAKAELVKALGPLKFPRTEVVGPKVSGELFRNGVLALVLGIGMMMTYIWFRFGLTFGIGAAAALIHDVLLTFGLFAFTQMEFTLTAVASILTIIGYSVNDTVVILDRIRENLRKFKKMPLGDVIDLSINETLSRTAITGVTGIMALTGLAVFGGDALLGFSISLIFGIVVGTYSSFYIAAPVLLLLGVKRGEEDEVRPAAAGAPQRP
ncbi:protein translocase subunit SecF [Phenylobacterium sp.]|uniref:protein translocase subunit SecF n=1 Tax=Phenylobacterium sp. TaxID=1871053 RepID=UPI002733B18E|nr:protein translocase subunit SecF [Phenylobacterium sp.]MDP3852227.1 protein translocase subunit SecF [Phenylobacterium sp.]